MRSVSRNIVSVSLLFASEGAAVFVLHRLGNVRELAVPGRGLGDWLATTEPEVVLIALSRLVALALAWWLLASTALYAFAQVLRRDALTAVIGVMTLPAVRRVLDRSVAGAVLATALFVRSPVAPAGASPATSPVTVEPRTGRLDPSGAPASDQIRVGRTTPPDPAPSTPTESGATPTPPAAPPPPADPVTPDLPTTPVPAPVAAAGTYVVGPGDSLWVIAARHVAGPGRNVAVVPANEIAPYWNLLIERNGPHLRSGDPNLIFPGEVIEVPPLPAP
jgi:LysM repeat protein